MDIVLPDYSEICSRVSPVVTNEIFIPSGVSVHQSLKSMSLTLMKGRLTRCWAGQAQYPDFLTFLIPHRSPRGTGPFATV